MKKHILGILALLFGITALGLAVIPGIILDRALPFAPKHRDEPVPPAAEPEGGVTLRIKKFSISIGGGKKDTNKNDQPAQDIRRAVEAENQRHRDRLFKWFSISAASCALIGLTFGPIAWAKEKQPALSGSAIGISCLALTWQYIVIGLAVGVAIAVLLTVLAHIAN